MPEKSIDNLLCTRYNVVNLLSEKNFGGYTVLSKFFRFIKKEAVLSTAGILAVISSFIVRPSREYISYIDFRVLSLLFCLMLVVAGLQSIGLFHNLAAVLLRGVTSSRRLILLLVSL